MTIDDRALYIYTSGTTGPPKAAIVSHARVMQWSHWFAGLMDVRSSDRMYNCLPMYHSVGGVLATGAVLVGGGSVVIRETILCAATSGATSSAGTAPCSSTSASCAGTCCTPSRTRMRRITGSGCVAATG